LHAVQGIGAARAADAQQLGAACRRPQPAANCPPAGGPSVRRSCGVRPARMPSRAGPRRSPRPHRVDAARRSRAAARACSRRSDNKRVAVARSGSVTELRRAGPRPARRPRVVWTVARSPTPAITARPSSIAVPGGRSGVGRSVLRWSARAFPSGREPVRGSVGRDRHDDGLAASPRRSTRDRPRVGTGLAAFGLPSSACLVVELRRTVTPQQGR
jgi:hypothetical protein